MSEDIQEINSSTEETLCNDIECITCDICGKFSYTRKQHSVHMKAHSKKNDCEICHKPFSTRKCRSRHYSEAHTDVMLNCFDCKIKYKNVYDMSLHKKFHTRECPYMCMVCLKCFYTLSGLKEHHTRQHEKKIEDMISVNKLFDDSPKDLDSNINEETYTDVGHDPVVSSEGYMCDVCGKTFALQRRLLSHTMLNHSSDTFHCDICKKGFKSRRRLNDHFRYYLGECKSTNRTRPKCKACSKTFCDAKEYRRHMEFHLPPGTFPCELCDKVYDFKAQLKKHLGWHKKQDKKMLEMKSDMIFSCEFCDKVFSNSKSLESHRRLHAESFPCTLCGRIFNKKWNLKTHMTIHLGDKPYSCSYCGTSYSDRSNLKKHLTKHPSELGAKIIVNKKPSIDSLKT